MSTFSIGRPASPTFSHASTEPSTANFQGGPERIITKKDLRSSLQAYEDLITAGKDFRLSLQSIAQASAGFATAIERCSRLKGMSDESGGGFLAAGGLQYLIANQENILSDSILKTFEQPLSQHLDGYRKRVTERSIAYERAQVELSRKIRQTEAENIRHGRRRQRDLQSFRAALTALQAQVDELDAVKSQYYNEVLAAEEETWDFVLSKVSHMVRATLDVYERITSKGTDPFLEPMLTANPDPFDSYGPPPGDNKMFSILTPLDISSPGLVGSTFEPSGTKTPTGADKVQSWIESGPVGPAAPANNADEQSTVTLKLPEAVRRSPLPPIEESRSVDELDEDEDPPDPETTPPSRRTNAAYGLSLNHAPASRDNHTTDETQETSTPRNPYFPSITDEPRWERAQATSPAG